MASNAPDLAQILGVPVTVTSGYRDPRKNALVGGVPNSDHLTDSARDFVPQGMSMADAAAKLKQAGYSKTLNEGNHVHVSYPQGPQVAQISDDDLMKALTGGTPSAHAIAAHGNPQDISDEQLLKALTSGGPEAPKPAAQAAQPGPKPTGTFGKMPFGFMEDATAKLPFAKDVMAAGASGLDMGAAALSGKPMPSFGQGYQTHMGELQAQQAQYEAQNPGLGGLATGASILAAGAPSRLVAAAKAGLPVLMKEGAKAGATLGGLFGLGTPDEGNTVSGRLGNAATGATLGAVTGGLVPPAAAGLAAGGRLVGRAANKLFPPAEDIASQRAKGIIEKFAGGPVTPNAAHEIVPGSKPTLAESVDNPGVSLLQKQITQLNPNSPILARLAQNNEARLAHLDTATGSAADIEKAQTLRDKAATAQRKQLFSASPAPVDIAPVTGTIQSILDGPSGKRPAVKAAMAEAKAILADNGKPITDPETLYQSARKGINDLISGKDLTKAYGAQAASQLIAVRDALDAAIEKTNKGFKKYLTDYATASTPIDAMQFLQGQKLTNDQGVITLHNVQTAIRRLETQKAAAGIKSGKAVTDAQQSVLENIRDDLLRQGKIDAGKARGSDSAQNLIQQASLGLVNGKPSTMSMLLPEIAGGGIGATIGHISGIPLAPELGGYIGDRIGKFAAVRSAAKTAASNDLTRAKLEEMLLNPGAYQAPPFANRSQASLNDLLNSQRARATFAGANRLAITPQLRQKQGAR